MKPGISSLKLFILCNIIYVANNLLFNTFNFIHDANYQIYIFYSRTYLHGSFLSNWAHTYINNVCITISDVFLLMLMEQETELCVHYTVGIL